MGWISGAGLAKVEQQTEKKRSRGRSPSPSEAFLASYLRTMADALVSIVLEKLTHVLGQQLSLFASATRELEKLRETFQSIQAVLADAEGRQVADKSVRLWLLRLRKVAYDIEDLLDEWLIAALEKDGDRFTPTTTSAPPRVKHMVHFSGGLGAAPNPPKPCINTCHV
ncbi:hypothetical protein ACLOJK_007849 [Asimina triloba]